MQRIPAFDGDHDGPFERIVFGLVMDGAVPIEIAPDLLRARLAGGRLVGVVRSGPDRAARLRAASAGMWRGGGVLVLAGGPPGARAELLAAAPSFVVGAPVEAVHVDDDGAVDGDGRLLPRNRTPDWDAFWARVAAPQAAPTEEPPVVSMAIVALCVAMFAVELAYRAGDFPPAMNRLGALIPARVRAGEVWRLGSSMFMHGGVVHIGMNLLALWSLGPGTERLFGRWRFALLYALAGIAGGIGATFVQKAPVVGASGAIWGLMTAQMVIVWRVRDRLPPDVYARMRKGALRGLFVNLAISAVPGIAWSAHFGGGLAGALVALAYPRPNEVVPVRWPLKAAAFAASAFVVLGTLYGALGTGAGLLAQPPAYARADLGWGSAELPVGLRREGDVTGDLAIDPGIVQVAPGPIETGGWKGFDDEGEGTEGGVSIHRYHRDSMRVAVARRAGDDTSPTVATVWWDKGSWDASVATRILRSIDVR